MNENQTTQNPENTPQEIQRKKKSNALCIAAVITGFVAPLLSLLLDLGSGSLLSAIMPYLILKSNSDPSISISNSAITAITFFEEIIAIVLSIIAYSVYPKNKSARILPIVFIIFYVFFTMILTYFFLIRKTCYGLD